MPRADPRRLLDLVSVGPATVGDLALLGVESVAALAREDPDELFDRLEALTGSRQDPCVRDVLHCAVAQARDPDLPAERRHWPWWSRQRKAGTTPR